MSEDVAAYLHTMHYETGETNPRLSFSSENPFGKPGKDYSAEYEVTVEPLYRLSTPAPADASGWRSAALEEAAQICERQAIDFLSPEYATGQPISSIQERFACTECASAIRAASDSSSGGRERSDTYEAGQYLFNALRTFLNMAGIDASECRLVIELPDRDKQRHLVGALQRDTGQRASARSAARIGNHGGRWQGVEYEFSFKGASSPPTPPRPIDMGEIERALEDVRAERERQKTVEGWTPKHDDEHQTGDLARAAVCYADPVDKDRENAPPNWPWDEAWWNPKDRRRDLVRAAALLLAEIERLDRQALAAIKGAGA